MPYFPPCLLSAFLLFSEDAQPLIPSWSQDPSTCPVPVLILEVPNLFSSCFCGI